MTSIQTKEAMSEARQAYLCYTCSKEVTFHGTRIRYNLDGSLHLCRTDDKLAYERYIRTNIRRDKRLTDEDFWKWRSVQRRDYYNELRKRRQREYEHEQHSRGGGRGEDTRILKTLKTMMRISSTKARAKSKVTLKNLTSENDRERTQNREMERYYHSLLGVPFGATLEQLNTAYEHRKALYNPANASNEDQDWAAAQLCKVNEAYAYLFDKDQKRQQKSFLAQEVR